MVAMFSLRRSNMVRLVAPLVALLATVLAPSAHAAKVQSPPKEQQALVLAGHSSEFASVNFVICSHAFNAKNKLGMLLWTTADRDHVMNLNAESKVYLRRTFDDWRLSDPSRAVHLSHVELVDKPELCGQKCTHYIGWQERRGEDTPVVEFWSLEKSPYGSPVSEAWCRLFNLPTEYGFPIQVKSIRAAQVVRRRRHGGGHGHWEHVFALSEIKHEPIASVVTKIPAGYREAKDRAELLFGSGGEPMKASDIDDLFEQPVR